MKKLFIVWGCHDEMTFVCESQSFLSGAVEYSVLLGLWPFRVKAPLTRLEQITRWHSVASQKKESRNLYVYCDVCHLKIMLVIH